MHLKLERKKKKKLTALATACFTLFMSSSRNLAVAIFRGQSSTPAPPRTGVALSLIHNTLNVNSNT